MAMSRQDWIEQFVAELAVVIGALAEVSATAAPSDAAPSGGWVTTLRAEGAARGTLSIRFDEAATEALTKRVMALDTIPPASMVIDTLKEMCAQAAGALAQEPPFSGVKLQVESVRAASDDGAADAVRMAVAVGAGETLRLSLWGDIAAVVAAPPGPALPEVVPSAASNPKLDVILDIDLPLVVRFGRTEMPLRALVALGPGSVIDLGRPPDESVEVMVSGQVVARGEVVIVGGNYGVRITDVLNPASRAQSIEGGL